MKNSYHFGKKNDFLVLDLLFQCVPLCIPSHVTWQDQMEFKSMFIEKLCVIFVFMLFQLSFRARIECSIICVPFKHFFFLTSFLISSLDCQSHIHCYLSKVFHCDSELKVAGFYSIRHSVFSSGSRTKFTYSLFRSQRVSRFPNWCLAFPYAIF